MFYFSVVLRRLAYCIAQCVVVFILLLCCHCVFHVFSQIQVKCNLGIDVRNETRNLKSLIEN